MVQNQLVKFNKSIYKAGGVTKLPSRHHQINTLLDQVEIYKSWEEKCNLGQEKYNLDLKKYK